MALAQINQDPGSAPKKSKLEHFSQGMDIAQGVAGLANTAYGMKAKGKELSALEKMMQEMQKRNEVK